MLCTIVSPHAAKCRWLVRFPSSFAHNKAATASNAAPPAPITATVACGAAPVAEEAALLAAELADDSNFETALPTTPETLTVTPERWLLSSLEMLEPIADVCED